jgi:hypothetical protein
MKRKLLVLVLSLALATAASLLPPQLSAVDCMCKGTYRQTGSAACSAGSCSAAQSCLASYLSDFTDCGFDGSCQETLIITQSCFQPGPGSYQVNGYLSYRCWVCV